MCPQNRLSSLYNFFSQRESDLAPKDFTVLVVGDQSEILSQSLKDAGFKVFQVPNNDLALTLMSKIYIDIVITDQTGQERENLLYDVHALPLFPKTSHIPVILVSSQEEDLALDYDDLILEDDISCLPERIISLVL